METYEELQNRHSQEIRALPLGFAYNKDQFAEMMKQLGVEDSSELYRLGNIGGFYKKTDAQLIRDTFKRQKKESRDAIFGPNGVNQEYTQHMLYYEMCNHEYEINMSGTTDVLEACDLTLEEVKNNPELRSAWEKARKQYFTDAKKNQ